MEGEKITKFDIMHACSPRRNVITQDDISGTLLGCVLRTALKKETSALLDELLLSPAIRKILALEFLAWRRAYETCPLETTLHLLAYDTLCPLNFLCHHIFMHKNV